MRRRDLDVAEGGSLAEFESGCEIPQPENKPGFREMGPDLQPYQGQFLTWPRLWYESGSKLIGRVGSGSGINHSG
jgi:hypothetical protein